MNCCYKKTHNSNYISNKISDMEKWSRLIKRGEEELKANNLESAENYLIEAVEECESVYGLKLLGETLFCRKKYREAIDVFRKAYVNSLSTSSEEQQGKAELLIQIANCEHLSGQDKNALQDYQKAIEIGSHTLSASQLAQVENQIKQLKSGIKSPYDKAKEFILLAREHCQNHQYSTAIELFNKSLKLLPKTKAYFYRGKCYAKIKDYYSAIQDYEKCIECIKSKKNLNIKFLFEVQFFYGRCLFEHEKYEEAEEQLEQSLKNSQEANCSLDSQLIESWISLIRERIKLIDQMQNFPSFMHNSKDITDLQRVTNEDILLPKKEGEIYHIVSRKWFNCWNGYGGDPVAHPGPINNIDLLLKKPILQDPDPFFEAVPIGLELLENEDFVLISHKIFLKLEKMFGAIDIKRYAYWEPRAKKIFVDVFLQKIKLHFRSECSWLELTTGVVYVRYLFTISDLKEKVLRFDIINKLVIRIKKQILN